MMLFQKKTKEEQSIAKKIRKKAKQSILKITEKSNSTSWRVKADKLFMSQGQGKPCAVCKKTDGTVFHHIIEKSRSRALRYDLMNVLPLCPLHHCNSNEIAPHATKRVAVTRWWTWLIANHPEKYVYCKKNEYSQSRFTYKEMFEKLNSEIEVMK